MKENLPWIRVLHIRRGSLERYVPGLYFTSTKRVIDLGGPGHLWHMKTRRFKTQCEAYAFLRTEQLRGDVVVFDQTAKNFPNQRGANNVIAGYVLSSVTLVDVPLTHAQLLEKL